MKSLLSLALCLCLVTPAFADGLLPPKASLETTITTPTTPESPPARSFTLDAGTRVPITIYNTVNSDNLKTGDMIAISVAENVKVNGHLVFKKGASGILNVSKSVKSGGHGRAGLLEINGGRLTDIYGHNHPINASLSSKGSSKRGWAIVSTILGIVVILVPFGLWVDGTPATIQGGQYVEALTTTATEIELPALAEVSHK